MQSDDGTPAGSPVRSFDVFDTVLTRAVGDPGAVICLVAVDLN